MSRGRIRTIIGTDPAAGAEISFTVPAGPLFLLTDLSFLFITSAVAGNRRVNVVVDNGTTGFRFGFTTSDQAASLERLYVLGRATDGLLSGVAISLGPTVPAGGAVFLAPEVQYPIPLLPGYRVRTVTVAIDVGDNYGAPALHGYEG